VTLGGSFSSNRMGTFLVDPHDLLMSGDITGLAGRRPSVAFYEGVDDTRSAVDERLKLIARVTAAD